MPWPPPPPPYLEGVLLRLLERGCRVRLEEPPQVIAQLAQGRGDLRSRQIHTEHHTQNSHPMPKPTHTHCDCDRHSLPPSSLPQLLAARSDSCSDTTCTIALLSFLLLAIILHHPQSTPFCTTFQPNSTSFFSPSSLSHLSSRNDKRLGRDQARALLHLRASPSGDDCAGVAVQRIAAGGRHFPAGFAAL